MKRPLMGALVTAVALTLTAAPALAEKKIRIATIAASNSPWHKAMNRFAEVAAKESNKELQVSVFTDAQLGDINQMYSSMQLGTLEMGYFGLGAIVLLKGAEQMNIAYVPYLFKSKESSVKVLTAPSS